jgi:hypothetical protein
MQGIIKSGGSILTLPFRYSYKYMSSLSFLLLLSRSRLCHYSIGAAWWHLGFYESF